MEPKQRPNALCLANVGDGTAVERIEEAIRSAVANCLDKNASWKKPRKVVFTVQLDVMDEDRDAIITSIEAKAVLPGETPGLGKAFVQIDAQTGEQYVVAVAKKGGEDGDVPGQQMLPGVPVDPPAREARVVQMPKAINE